MLLKGMKPGLDSVLFTEQKIMFLSLSLYV